MSGDAKTMMDDRCDVMMVDDDQLALLVMTRRLSDTGLTLETRSEPTAALEWLRAGRTRLLLVDFHMESINGVELLETLHAEGRLESTRAFLCSAVRPDAATTTRVKGLGAGVLLKETVLASGTVERLLASGRAPSGVSRPSRDPALPRRSDGYGSGCVPRAGRRRVGTR